MGQVTKGKVFIGKRDIDIFNFLYQNKVASYQQLVEWIFPAVKSRSAYKSINRLVHAGLLYKVARVHMGRPAVAYSLSEKCFKRYFLQDHDSEMSRRFKSDSVEHDITLVDIQRRFGELKSLLSYYPENILQTRSEFINCLPLEDFIELHADAVTQLSHQGKSYYVGIEYEACFKFSSRYREKLLGYHSRENVGTVVFVCANGQIKKSIMAVERKHCADFYPKIYYCELDDLLNRGQPMAFSNIKNGRFVIH